ncbi:MAG: hypothetical protein KKC76_14255 [Proteobacteria bacterium]|nr:hypothetical protein [Pseudomonadota bacterium]MBU4297747.1 hypothetical protein [Pseudomonadota bacterium]MCG2748282.1 hypothetical protein [Desulfobulbaceae bacterium]
MMTKVRDYNALRGEDGFAVHWCSPAQTSTFVGKVTKMKEGDNFVGGAVEK